MYIYRCRNRLIHKTWYQPVIEISEPPNLGPEKVWHAGS